jgi:hypothetical protein
MYSVEQVREIEMALKKLKNARIDAIGKELDSEEDPQVSSLRTIHEGDILDVVVKLRQLMSMVETCSFSLYSSFKDIGGRPLEQEAQKTRNTLELATARIANLVTSLEKTEPYQAAKRAALKREK